MSQVIDWFAPAREDSPPVTLTVQMLNDAFDKMLSEGNLPSLSIMKQRTYERLRHNLKRRPAPRYCMKARKRMRRR